jgi:hypothetical protein
MISKIIIVLGLNLPRQSVYIRNKVREGKMIVVRHHVTIA